ncbi:MAG: hypothetical protein KF795_10330 [Labilithrix sp.]|nr:hypothetical protein [Labilithrix sp.]
MSETHGNPSDHHHAPPAPPEPKTPMWLSALGAVLFLIAGLIWGLSPSSTQPGEQPAGSAPGANAGAAGEH